MKPILKFAIFFFLGGVLTLISCKKETPVSTVVTQPLPPPPPPPNHSPGLLQSPLPPFLPVHDSLSGREFLYNNLVWETWGDPYIEVELPNSHLFLNRGIEVFIDSSSTLVNVPFYTVEYGYETVFQFPANNGYVYDNNYFDSVFLFAIAANKNQLIGKKVSVMVKVL
jgi:hypothetical protein